MFEYDNLAKLEKRQSKTIATNLRSSPTFSFSRKILGQLKEYIHLIAFVLLF